MTTQQLKSFLTSRNVALRRSQQSKKAYRDQALALVQQGQRKRKAEDFEDAPASKRAKTEVHRLVSNLSDLVPLVVGYDALWTASLFRTCFACKLRSNAVSFVVCGGLCLAFVR
jgi:hypothetical protein